MNSLMCVVFVYSVPMHSGLAAFVYIKMKFPNGNIPGTVAAQAQWWAQHYHEGGGVVAEFVTKANEMGLNPGMKLSGSKN